MQALYPDLPWPHLIAGEAMLAKGDAGGRPGRAAGVAGDQSVRSRACTARWPNAYGKLPPAERAAAPRRVAREQRFCRSLAEAD